jgi:hypothetical protein
MADCKHYQRLISGFIDKELTEEELTDLNGHLTRCRACRREVEIMKKSASVLEQLSFAEPGDKILNNLWRNPFTKTLRLSAFLALIGGWLTLAVYAFFQFLRDPVEPAIPKVAIAAMVTGAIFLFLYVAFERILTYKDDPYKEVQR